jgi:hypothetical protein
MPVVVPTPKHTPGPWSWVGNRLRAETPDPATSAVHSILDREGGYGFLGRALKDTQRELEADYPLIQAAPTVLEALQQLLAVCKAMDAEVQGDRPTEDEYQAALIYAQAAIALCGAEEATYQATPQAEERASTQARSAAKAELP